MAHVLILEGAGADYSGGRTVLYAFSNSTYDLTASSTNILVETGSTTVLTISDLNTSNSNSDLVTGTSVSGGVIPDLPSDFVGGKYNLKLTGTTWSFEIRTAYAELIEEFSDSFIKVNTAGSSSGSGGLTVESGSDDAKIYFTHSDNKWRKGVGNTNYEIVGRTEAQTLTDKTISTANNTITHASTGDLGVASFCSNNFSVSNGAVCIKNNGITLGTHTTGNYVSTITGGSGISSTGTTTGENISHTLSIDESVVVTLTGTQTLTNKTLTSPTVSGLYLSDSSIVFEGSSNDYETTLSVVEPTSDKTISLPTPSANDTVTLLAETQTLTNKTLTSPVISGGTIDNNVIGGTTPAAGTFTTGTFTSGSFTTSITVGSSSLTLDSNSITVSNDNTASNRNLQLIPGDQVDGTLNTPFCVGHVEIINSGYGLRIGADQYYNSGSYGVYGTSTISNGDKNKIASIVTPSYNQNGSVKDNALLYSVAESSATEIFYGGLPSGTTHAYPATKHAFMTGTASELQDPTPTQQMSITPSGVSVFNKLHVDVGESELTFDNDAPFSNANLRIWRNDTSITSGNPLGYLSFAGSDANTSPTDHATIYADAASSHSDGDNPTNLKFQTTDDGSQLPADRMTIRYDGNVGIGTTAPTVKLDVNGVIKGTGITIGNSTSISSVDTDLSSVSGSDDTLASAKSIKTYVDTQITAQDLDFQGDSGGALNIDLDSEVLTLTGGSAITTTGSGNTITIDLSVDDSTVEIASDTLKVKDLGITTAKIADTNVTTAKIADSNVTTAKIADSNVTTAKIADASVTTAKIADSNVTTDKIADSNVTTAKIDDANVTTDKIADANVTTAKIADSNVTTAKIADSNVTTAKIADANVTTAKIVDANVTTDKINNSAVTTAKIADASVTTAKIADSNVTTDKIADSNVTTAKIDDANVTTDKIADANVTTAKIADSNVTTAKIADSNVTTAKIADANVTTAKIVDANVTTDKINNSAVTTAKIADANVTTDKIADSNVTNAKLSNSSITVTAGGGLSTGGSVSLGSSVTLDHADTSSQASVDNSGSTVIQDITLDTYGHVTSLGSVQVTSTLAGATDTNINTPSSAHILVYDGNDSWDNKAISGDITINSSGVASIQADSVTLGTDTTGNYVSTITGGNGVSSTGATTGENISHTLSVDTKTNGGLVFESNKLTLDLGASTITGTLAISDGGTGATDASGARSALGVDASGTDNSTNVTLVTTSHDYLSISGQAITLGTIDIGDDTNLTAGSGITLSGDTLSVNTSAVDHDSLSNFVANEHIDWTTSGAGTIHSNNLPTVSNVTVTDNNDNSNYDVTFTNGSNALLEDNGEFYYNPSTGTLRVPNLTVEGTTTTVDSVQMQAQNAIVFEGETADEYETTLTITDPTADRTITLPNINGTLITTGNLSDITTVGTVSSGTWQGTAITDTYIASESTWNAKLDTAGTGLTKSGTTINLDSSQSLSSLTVSGSTALNGGITVDTNAFIVADSTGTVTSTGNLNFSGTGNSNIVGKLGVGLASSAMTGSTLEIGTGALRVKNATVDSQGFNISQESSNISRIHNAFDDGVITFGNKATHCERMRLDSSGQLGIGTSPATTLHIKSANPVIKLEDSDPDTVYGQIDGAGGTLILIADGGGAAASSAIKFRIDGGTASSDKMVILDSGNVGVGNNSPAEKLHVDGAIRLGTTSNEVAGNLRWTGSQFQGYSGSEWLNLGAGGGAGTPTINSGVAKSLAYYDSAGNQLSDTETTSGDGVYWDSTNDRLGIGTSTPSSTLDVNGHLSATTKSFDIEHPSKEGKRLIHGSLEGPEHGVYIRGRTNGEKEVELPEYWIDLVDLDTITVQLTAIGNKQDIWVASIDNSRIKIGSDMGFVDCFYFIQAERKDVDKLQIEVEEVSSNG